MGAPTIYVRNQSTVVADAEARRMVASIGVQMARDFAPVWGVNPKIAYAEPGAYFLKTDWPVYLLDDSDPAGALGYHTLDSRAQPCAFVFAKTALSYGESVSADLSHEILELALDPYCVAVAFDGRSKLHALEAADAVQADHCGYHINGVLVSDFLFPAWFGAGGKRFSFANSISAPFTLAAGGYTATLTVAAASEWRDDTARRWKLETADGAAVPAAKLTPYHRKSRRLKIANRGTA